LITGAAGGIGRALAAELVRREAAGLALVDQNESVHQMAAATNELAGAQVAFGFSGDVTDAGFRRTVYSEMEAKRGRVTICVPAAGITRDQLAVKLDKETKQVVVYPLEEFRQVTEVNLIAPVYWALEMLAGIAEHRARQGLKRWAPAEPTQGAVVFIGSVSSQGNKGQIAYAATKAGLEGAASTLALEARYYGVRCSIVHPGFTDTPMVRSLGEEIIQETVIPQTLLGRLIRPEEIADAICFLIANDTVTGPLWADAGWRPVG
jgi:3-oxoacyl-[acyl-carrier protein] reductase